MLLGRRGLRRKGYKLLTQRRHQLAPQVVLVVVKDEDNKY